MGASPFASALAAVLKPLAFAARDDFGHLDRVRGLEATVAAAAARGRELAVPPDARTVFAEVAEAFAEPLEADRRRAAIDRARALLEPLADPGWPEAALARPTTRLAGVGPRRAEALARRGLRCVGDLLFQLPTRYDDRRSLAQVGDLEVGRRATFVARVLVCDFVARRGRTRGRGGRMFEAVVGDDTGTAHLRWFHGSEAIARTVQKGALLLVTGDVRRYRFSKEIVHPEIERLDRRDAEVEAVDAASLRQIVPGYAGVEGLHPLALRRIVQQAVAHYADLVEGHLPERVARERRLPPPAEALRRLHRPDPEADVETLEAGRSPAAVRLVLEELYLLELGLALRRESRAREPGIPIPADGPRAAAPATLPFALTAAQERVWREIRADLARAHPMNRLLQGDVGSGKTAVAFLAAAAVADGGYQAALMAPTELLAEQHARTLRCLAEGAETGGRLRIALLTASMPNAEAEATRRSVAGGDVDLVVGTHALVQESVAFHRLALAVVDEQHRFGVLQRAALTAKAGEGRSPHILVMTATPIPRTLALTVYGDLDLSVIDELPPGRAPADTLLLRAGEGRRIAALLRETVGRGEQVYVVYPLVEESEKSDLRAARESAERIRTAFPDLRVDLVHGRMSAAERGAAMARFETGETQVLVSTTVIEVGVDVPRATLMIVEHAERFGLAQLHQLRGRVGRGAKPGTCVLVARGATEESEARLRAILETTDGFAIAEQDLRIRGPGEFLGTRQHGRLPDLRIADLVRDARQVAVAREAALATVREDSGLRRDPALARAVRARWGERLALVDVG
jgi:ATP-dependent DNA helicase RecG